MLITTAGADPADRDAVLSLLNRAGATVTAQIQLTNDFSDPARADELRAMAATTLPTGAKLPEVPQAGAIAGGLLGSVLDRPGRRSGRGQRRTERRRARRPDQCRLHHGDRHPGGRVSPSSS